MKAKEIISNVVENVAGHDVLPLIDVLEGKQNVSEFTLADELKKEINTVRNMLYRLYDYNLVSFTRKKDKKKGWYIYYWTFIPSRIPHISKEIKSSRLNKLKERLAKEEKSNFFECKNKCMRLEFDKAIDYEFKCPECGSLMNETDNRKRILSIEKEIKKIEVEIASIPEIPSEEFIEEKDEKIVIKPTKVKVGSKKKKVKETKPKNTVKKASKKKK